MTASAAHRGTAPVQDGQYRGPRAVHPATVLRWLRNGALLCVAAAALLYLWVAIQAGSDLAGVNRTRESLTNIQDASNAAAGAQAALSRVFSREDATLVSTGSDFVNQISLVNKDLTLAAEGNAAGATGTAEIQYVQNQLTSYLQLSETAVRDYALGAPLGRAGESYASGGLSDVQSAISGLRKAEQTALSAQRGAWALTPGTFWWVLLGPVIGELLLVAATAQVLAGHFRRHLSRWLWGSLLTLTAVAVTTGIFNASDARNMSADPWAGHPATMTIAALLFLSAAAQAYFAYRPRLAEYRFQPS